MPDESFAVPPALLPGSRVVLARPDNPNHFRKGLTGVVREASVHWPPAPFQRPGQPPQSRPPARVWLWVRFPTCPHNKNKPFASPVRGHELTKA